MFKKLLTEKYYLRLILIFLVLCISIILIGYYFYQRQTEIKEKGCFQLPSKRC